MKSQQIACDEKKQIEAALAEVRTEVEELVWKNKELESNLTKAHARIIKLEQMLNARHGGMG